MEIMVKARQEFELALSLHEHDNAVSNDLPASNDLPGITLNKDDIQSIIPYLQHLHKYCMQCVKYSCLTDKDIFDSNVHW